METEIKTRLLNAFPDAQIKLKDLTGGQDHWALEIASTAFSGKGLVAQHQLVYKALGELMKQKIHALALTTKTI